MEGGGAVGQRAGHRMMLLGGEGRVGCRIQLSLSP